MICVECDFLETCFTLFPSVSLLALPLHFPRTADFVLACLKHTNAWWYHIYYIEDSQRLDLASDTASRADE